MAIDLGTKNSPKRGEVWDQVVKPLCSMAKNLGLGNYPTSRDSWMNQTGLSPTGAWWKTVKDNAKALADWYGEAFSASSTLDTFNKAKTFVGKIQAAYQAAYQAPPDVPLVSNEFGTGPTGSGNLSPDSNVFTSAGSNSTAGYSTEIPITTIPPSGGNLAGMTTELSTSEVQVESPSRWGLWLAGAGLAVAGGFVWLTRSR